MGANLVMDIFIFQDDVFVFEDFGNVGSDED
jgi:hypothetical protein